MRRTKEEAEQTKQQIMTSAIKVMNNRGIGATRFEDIAKEAGVTRGAIYHYFKSKNEIIFTVHANMKHQMMELFARHISDDVDPAVSLKNGLKEVLRRFQNDEHYRAVEELFLKTEFASLLKEDDELMELLHKEKENTVCDMMELVKRGQESGSLRKDIAQQNLGFALISCYVGFITTWFLRMEHISDEGIVDDYIDILLHGILK